MASNHIRRTQTVGTRLNAMQSDLDAVRKRSKSTAVADAEVDARLAALEAGENEAVTPSLLLQDLLPELDERYEVSGTTIPNASEAVPGIVELSTATEAQYGTDNTRAVTPAALKSAMSSWIAADYGYSEQTSDWNVIMKVGFFWSEGTASNRPSGGSASNYYIGTHMNAGTYAPPAAATNLSHIQEVYEVNATTGQIVTSWRRAKANATWAAWTNGGIGAIPDATTTEKGLVELATPAEATAGTDQSRAVTPLGLKTVADTKAALNHLHSIEGVVGLQEELDDKADIVHTHIATEIVDFEQAVNSALPLASTAQDGIVELATPEEAVAGIDAARAITPYALKAVTDALAGTINEELTGSIVDAITTADEALAVANNKNSVVYANSIPVGSEYAIGDTWYDTGNGNKIHRWDGANWVPAELGSGAISNGAVSTQHIAANAVTIAQLANGSVTQEKIGPGAVGQTEIADFAITVKKMNTTRHMLF